MIKFSHQLSQSTCTHICLYVHRFGQLASASHVLRAAASGLRGQPSGLNQRGKRVCEDTRGEKRRFTKWTAEMNSLLQEVSICLFLYFMPLLVSAFTDAISYLSIRRSRKPRPLLAMRSTPAGRASWAYMCRLLLLTWRLSRMGQWTRKWVRCSKTSSRCCAR